MRVSCSLGSLLTVNEIIQCSKSLGGTITDTIWIPETWGMECFSILGAVSTTNNTQNLGSSIINIYSRSPLTIAMGAATADTLSNGRLILGLGTSSIPIVQSLHGYKFDRPLQRMIEYVEIIRLALSQKPITYHGKIFNLDNFTLLIKPQQTNIPIYIAAINKKMINLAWGIADGVILYLRPLHEMQKTIPYMQSKKKIDVACQLITCVSKNSEEATYKAKKTIAFYVSVGEIYRKFLAENGYKSETDAILEQFKKTGLKSVHESVTDSMADALAIYGTPDECTAQLKKFTDAGITHPILQFNPLGNTTESFNLFTRTFLRD